MKIYIIIVSVLAGIGVAFTINQIAKSEWKELRWFPETKIIYSTLAILIWTLLAADTLLLIGLLTGTLPQA